MNTNSLSGCWVLRNQGSDYLPGLEDIPGVPFPAMLMPDSDCWLNISQRRSPGDVEEIVIAYRSTRTETRSYQVNKLNYERVAPPGIIVAVVGSVSKDFQEFRLMRYGPVAGQKSEEMYNLDEKGEEIRVSMEVRTPDGLSFKLVRYLIRTNDMGLKSSDFFPFSLSSKSYGWSKPEFHCLDVLRGLTVKILEPLSITTPSDGIPLPASDSSKPTKYIFTKRFGDHVSNGENITVYEVLVKTEKFAWIVPHRYREFLCLKDFVDQEMRRHGPMDGGALPAFPGKMVRSLTGQQLQTRQEGLENYVSALLFSMTRGYGNSALIDVVCGFLEIPENKQAVLQPASVSPAPSTPGARPLPTPPSKGKYGVPDTVVTATSNSTSNNTSVSSAPKQNLPPQPASFKIPKAERGTRPAISRVDSVQINSSQSQQQVAADTLYSMLHTGLLVIKHGRSGKPHKRMLLCDNGVTRIYWSSDYKAKDKDENSLEELPSESKSINLMDVIDVRAGLDTDPANEKWLGSSNLRRTAKTENLHRCVSVITRERTFDIEFLNLADYDAFFPSLIVHVKCLKDNRSLSIRNMNADGVLTI